MMTVNRNLISKTFFKNVKYLLLLVFCLTMNKAGAQSDPADQVYQYSVAVGSRTAYLWIPPQCNRVRGVIMSLSNLTERRWLEDPLIRHTAAEEGLGIIWLGPGKRGNPDNPLTADMKPGAAQALQKMLDDFAAESGYDELSNAPFIPMGHSANGHFAWTFAKTFPERTIAAIPIKTIPFPDNLGFTGIPVCYVVGETTEWPQFRVPDPATQPGDRDFYWPVVKKGALNLREQNEDNLVAVVTDPGGGHFDWSEHLARFVALYIKKACTYRLSDDGSAKLKPVKKESGWLTGAGGMEQDAFKPAPYTAYKGKTGGAYWLFDKELALAAYAFQGDRVKRQKQMLTFIQDGKQLPVAKLGYAPLKFEPQADALSFKVEGDFLSALPPELIGGGTKLGHAAGPIQFKLITGPAVQTGPDSFRVQFDRSGAGGEIWIQEEHPGNKQYRHAVQPGQVRIPAKLTEGKAQLIIFPEIGNQKKGSKEVLLKGTADSGLPVSYYVVSGPAYVQDGKLKFTAVPVKSKFPVKVTVVAYQWGRTIEPLYQSAEMVEQTFSIL